MIICFLQDPGSLPTASRIGDWRQERKSTRSQNSADLCRGQRGSSARGHVGLVQIRHHVVPAELQQPRRAKVEAAQRLQRQARQRLLLQLACARG